MITHDAALADRLPRQIRMLDGQVVSDCGSPDELPDGAAATGGAP
jgi:putative ABC transport system ATP-binding protein